MSFDFLFNFILYIATKYIPNVGMCFHCIYKYFIQIAFQSKINCIMCVINVLYSSKDFCRNLICYLIIKYIVGTSFLLKNSLV